LNKSVFEHFKKITQIPHCSHKTELLRDYILEQVEKVNYKVAVDEHQNIMIRSINKPKITLQAHYDMVCVGNAPEINLIEETDTKNNKKYIFAENSSLGADDGFGIAIILALLEEKYDFEALLTNDEEVGLIGAVNLKIAFGTNKLVNLDSNSFDSIIIGSAGGTLLKAKLPIQTQNIDNLTQDLSQKAPSQGRFSFQEISFVNSQQRFFYEIDFINFSGGHSGIDIHKNIESAIKFGLNFLKKVLELDEVNLFHFVEIEGGENSNSIPTNFKVKFISDIKVEHLMQLKNHSNLSENIQITELNLEKNQKIISNSVDIFIFLDNIFNNFQGVLEHNEKLKIPEISNNFGKIISDSNNLLISSYIRGMDTFKLNLATQNLIRKFQSFDFDVSIQSNSPAWKPIETDFTKTILDIYSQVNPNVELKAVHAGLETAVFKEKNPNLEIVSLGANVYDLHSINEKMEIDSLFKLYEIVKLILQKA
jgi:dipeptidase D